MSALSDRSQRRVPYLAVALVVSAPALMWLGLAGSVAGLYAAAFILGFFMTSALPVGMEYSAEITAPTPGRHLQRVDPAGGPDLSGVRLPDGRHPDVFRVVRSLALRARRSAPPGRAGRVAPARTGTAPRDG